MLLRRQLGEAQSVTGDQSGAWWRRKGEDVGMMVVLMMMVKRSGGVGVGRN